MYCAVVEQSTAASRVEGSIPERYKYLYGLQTVIPGLGVCACSYENFIKFCIIKNEQKYILHRP